MAKHKKAGIAAYHAAVAEIARSEGVSTMEARRLYSERKASGGTAAPVLQSQLMGSNGKFSPGQVIEIVNTNKTRLGSEIAKLQAELTSWESISVPGDAHSHKR